MTATSDFSAIWTPRLQALLRIVVALLFLQHGTSKYFGFPGSAIPDLSPFTLIGLAGVLEIVGGLLMLVGLFTRPAAFILAGEMAFAYFMGHAPKGLFTPLQNGGEAAVLYCFVFLFFWAAGAGAFSVDAARNRD